MKRSIPALAIIVVLSFTACSSSSKINGVKFEKDEILSTLNDKSQPDWADESQPFKISGNKVYSVGVTTLRGSDRPEAGARIAENSARANYSKTIENRMEFVFQNSEENSSIDSTQAKFIGSEVSNLTSHSMTVEGNWWKRYAQSDEDGSRHIYYKIYSLVTMPEVDLKQAILASINRGVNQHKLSETFQKQVNQQWDRFVENKPAQAPDQRVPAASPKQPTEDKSAE